MMPSVNGDQRLGASIDASERRGWADHAAFERTLDAADWIFPPDSSRHVALSALILYIRGDRCYSAST